MTSYSMFRLFLRLEKPGRLPFFGNVGITCTSSLVERHQLAVGNKWDEQRKQLTAKDANIRHNLGYYRRFYSTAVSTTQVLESDKAREQEGPKKKAKTVESAKIMLMSETHNYTIMTLEDAQKIAEKKAMHLVPLGDNHISKDKPVYRLLTNAEFLGMEEAEGQASDEIKEEKKKELKEVKTVILKSKIADNDLLSKVKQMIRWIDKNHPIKVMIGQTGEKGDAGHVYKVMEEQLKVTGARFLQKVVKEHQIRVQIMPGKEEPRKTGKKTIEDKPAKKS